jgi:glycerol-3-phosphate dehydrogenase (NAD(P)+)
MKIAVIGAGSWGTTVALLLNQKRYDVSLWVRSIETYIDINKNKRNSKYTFDAYIPEEIKIFHDIDDLDEDIEVIIFAVPSDFLRDTLVRFYSKIEKNIGSLKALINLAKGIELGSNLRPSQVLRQVLPTKLKDLVATMSGPNISKEVLQGLPSVTVISSENKNILKYIQKIFYTDYFRVYTNEDIIGVEIGGAVKNIIAIAAGISDGLKYGSNAKASLITRGLYEISKLGISLGAKPVTFSGAAGMGDLIATCISPYSRNRSVGEKIAKGMKINEIIDSMYMVAEGVKTTKAVYNIASSLHIDMPVTESLYKIIYEENSPVESVNNLMKRKFKPEIEF